MDNAKIRVSRAVLVEGRYDRIALENILDATILTTDGFSVFNNTEKRELLRRVAEERGLLVLTDSDGGGRQIRAFLSGFLPKEKVIHLYTPRVPGKEKRKKQSSREGILGVEGQDAETLREIFRPFADDAPQKQCTPLTKTDLYELGYLGGEGSSARRCAFLSAHGFPDLSSNAMLAALNLLGGREAFLDELRAGAGN